MAGASNTGQDIHQLESSFVPRIIKSELNFRPEWKIGEPIETNHAAVLWLDICKFSPLCNKLMEDPKGGVEKITNILNTHYNFLLRTISEFGGQPLFFVGDGLMSAWPCAESDIELNLRLAISCSKKILAEKRTVDDDNNILPLHCIIADGEWKMTDLDILRNKKLLSFYGGVFENLKKATNIRAPDHVLIANSSLSKIKWQSKYIQLNEYTSQLMEIPEVAAPEYEYDLHLSNEVAEQLLAFAPITLPYPLNIERLKWIAEIRPVTNVFVRLPFVHKDTDSHLRELKEVAAIVTPILLKYDGLLTQVWMDEKDSNMLISFGPPPSAHQDNPERAIKLSMELGSKLMAANFDHGIGVCTGKAYCGLLGNEIFRQYTIIGDSVNLSSRMAGFGMNRISCDQSTYTASKHAIKYKEPIFHNVKGHDKPIKAFTPISTIEKSSSRIKIQTSIGREREMEQLLHVLGLIENGANKLVVIEGKSGLGKTKLLEDFKNKIQSPNTQIIKTTGDYITREVPYNIWREVFSDLLDFDHAKPEHLQLSKLEKIENEYGSKACLFNIVLQTSIPESQEVANYTAVQKVELTAEFLFTILEKESKKGNLIFFIDRGHWMDVTSWNLLKSVVSRLSHCMVNITIQGEEEFPYALNEFDNLVKINLEPLDDQDIEKIICTKLGVQRVSEDVGDLIKKIAKGNPLFSIELTGSLLDQDLLEFTNGSCSFVKGTTINEMEMPETVRGAVRMRIDRLLPGSQLSLKVGSVVGDRFGVEIVKNIYPIKNERRGVPSFLKEAKKSGFIEDMVIDTFDGYAFNNPTTAEVAYEMTLLEHRKFLHQACAEWYENKFYEDLYPYFVRLAHHWEQAGDIIKASEYIELECQKLTSAGYSKQSIELGIKGLNLFEFELDPDPKAVEEKIGENLGKIQELIGTRSIQEFANSPLLEDKNLERFIVMLTHIAPNMYIGGRIDIFALLSVLGLRTSIENGISDATADVYSMYAIIHRGMMGDSLGAYEWSKLALDTDDKFGGKVRSRVCHVHAWFINHWVRPIHETLPISKKGIDSGVESGDVMFTCFNLAGYVTFMAFAGEHLDDVISTGRLHYKIADNRVMNSVFHTVMEIQVAKALKGETVGYTSLTDSEFDQKTHLDYVLKSDFVNQIGCYYVMRLKMHTHFGEWEKGLDWAAHVPPMYPMIASQIAEIEYELFFSIASLYQAYDSEGEKKKAHLKNADDSLQKMQGYSLICLHNFEQKALLLEAIKTGLFGDFEASMSLFDKAVSAAGKHAFLNDKALIFEHKFRIQKKLGKTTSALNDAIDAWNQIGAHGKVQHLKELESK